MLDDMARAARAMGCTGAAWLLAVLLGAAAPARGAGVSTTGTILLLNSYHPGYAWSDAETQGILSTLTKTRPGITCFDEYLDTKRFPNEAHLENVARAIAHKYAKRPIRLVMTTDDPALRFALRHRPTLFPSAPIVFCGVNEYTTATLNGETNVTGIGEMQDMAGTLDIILQLQPETKRVVVLHDYSITGLGSWHQCQHVAPQFAGRLTLREMPNLPLNGVLGELRRLEPGTVVLMPSYSIDAAGQAYEPADIDPMFSRNCSVPIYVTLDPRLRNGTVGGSILTGKAHGERAAGLVLRILDGESPSAIAPAMANTSHPWFDYRQLRRFGLRLSDLPAGSKFVNRPPTFAGRHPTLMVSACVFLAGLITTVVLLVSDAAKRHRTELALRTSEELFRKAFRSSPLAVIIATPYEGRLLDVSDRFTQMLGYAREEAVGQTMLDLDIWHNPEIRAQLVTELMARGSIALRDAVWRRKDGQLLHVIWSADMIEIDGQDRVLSTVLDVTEQRQAEAALRLTRSALDQVSDCAYVVRDDSRFVYVNNTICRTLGYSREDFLERLRAWDIQEGMTAAVWPERWAQVEALGSAIMEQGFRTRDGRIIPVEVSRGFVETDGGKYIFALARNLTDRKRMEEEKAKIDRQIREAQKLESLGVLAGGIAHDFNNLLTGVLGNADLALQGLPPSSPVRQYMERIETDACRAAELTRQMLAYSGRGQFDVRTLCLSDFVAEMTSLLEASISKKCVLKCEFDQNVPPISADAAQLRQTVINLVVNASEAIGEASGTITVRTGVVECDRAYLERSFVDDNLEPGRYVYLEVADTGEGMPPDVRGRIFDPFFTTKFTGRGLGLPAVLGIVRGHRGFIDVQSEPGQGSTFRVLLPPAAEPLPAPPEPVSKPPAPKGTGLVLVADDEEGVRSLVKTYLTLAGFDVLTACDGAEAVTAFAREAPRVRLVLLDLTMPGMGGEEAYAELRRIRADVPVVLMSGYSEQDATSRFADKALAGFLQKPFRMEEFAAVVWPCLQAASKPLGPAMTL